MKIGYRDMDSFSKKPDPAARVILVFGPDYGLMRERSTAIAQSVVADINDPFNVAVLTSDQVASDPACLNDEANAISMLGGNRLIRIENASEKVVPALKEYLKNPSPDNLVLVEADELSTKSSLRGLCERAKNAAAVACYADDVRAVSNIIRTRLKEEGITIQNDAAIWFAENVNGDRLKILGEIEKLLTYQGLGTEHVSREIILDDVMSCCGEAGALSFDDLVFNLGGAQTKKTLKAYNQLLDEGVSVVGVLRASQRHFRRLHFVKTLISNGIPVKEAVKKLQPQVFFKYEDAFIAQVNRWPEPALRHIISRLNELEAQSKTTGCPDETLCSQALLSISSR